MDEELEQIDKMRTSKLVMFPEGAWVVKNKLVYFSTKDSEGR